MRLKKGILFLALLLLLQTFASCQTTGNGKETDSKGDGGGTIDTTVDHGNDSSDAETFLNLVESGKTNFEIVYPNEATVEELAGVNQLIRLFEEYTGVRLVSKSDHQWESDTLADDEKLILLGKTDHTASIKAYQNLTYHDYKVKVSQNALVIAAHSADGYAGALDWLEKNVFSNTTEEAGTNLTMSSKQTVHYTHGDYEYTSWKISGTELKEYKIVYADDAILTDLTGLVREIGECYGHMLEVVKDTKSEETEYEILFGNTNRSASAQAETPAALHYAYTVVDNKLVVKSGGLHSMLSAIQFFITNFDSGNDKINVYKSTVIKEDSYNESNDITMAKDADIRVMSANLMANYTSYDGGWGQQFAFERRVEIFLSALDFYQPTVVGVQEACPSWHAKIKEMYDSEKWQLITFDNPYQTTPVVFSTILYRKDLYTLLDSGTEPYSESAEVNNKNTRYISWAILKDKATGQEFCFISTHWGGGTETIQPNELSAFIQEKAKTYPVIAAGDYNKTDFSAHIQNLLTDSNSVDAMYAAKEKVNVMNAEHSTGPMVQTGTGSSYVHVVVNKDHADVLRFQVLTRNDISYASDHYWLLVDIDFQ